MGAVPAVFIAYSQNTSSAFSVALFYLVFYQIDGNILMPRIMGSKIDLHPVVLILSLLIGAKCTVFWVCSLPCRWLLYTGSCIKNYGIVLTNLGQQKLSSKNDDD